MNKKERLEYIKQFENNFFGETLVKLKKSTLAGLTKQQFCHKIERYFDEADEYINDKSINDDNRDIWKFRKYILCKIYEYINKSSNIVYELTT